jgi:cysteine sulfinate desulfinase/cysteine desulfurase-like protein
VPDSVLHSAVRFSFGPTTEFADIDEAADRIGHAVQQIRTPVD